MLTAVELIGYGALGLLVMFYKGGRGPRVR